MMTFSAAFVLVVGIGMLAQWTISFMRKEIPELRSEPVRIGFHLAAEICTAVLLIGGGIGLLVGAPWALGIFYVSMGMLIYTAIASPGYFAQQRKWGWVVIFVSLIAVAIFALLAVSGHAIS